MVFMNIKQAILILKEMTPNKEYSSSDFKTLFITKSHSSSGASFAWFVSICRAYNIISIEKKGRENFYKLNSAGVKKYE